MIGRPGGKAHLITIVQDIKEVFHYATLLSFTILEFKSFVILSLCRPLLRLGFVAPPELKFRSDLLLPNLVLSCLMYWLNWRLCSIGRIVSRLIFCSSLRHAFDQLKLSKTNANSITINGFFVLHWMSWISK